MILKTSSRGRGACDALPRDSCAGGSLPVCPPCEAHARPACRDEARATLRGVRAVCRPPPRGNRPPCPTSPPPCSITCEHLHAQETPSGGRSACDALPQDLCAGGATLSAVRAAGPPCPTCPPRCPTCPSTRAFTYEHLYAQDSSKSSSMNEVQCSTKLSNATSGSCGDTLDRVAQRISAAKLARRLEYEREVAERKKLIASPPPPTKYWLGVDRETVRATDGRDYIVLHPNSTAAADSNIQRRTDTESSTVELDPATSCDINRVPHVDPCAHHPRILLKIDRSDANNSSSSHRVSSPPNFISKPLQCTPTTSNQLRSQDYSGLSKKIDNKVTVPKKQCKGNGPENLTDWCSSPPKMAPEPPRCRQPSLVERLRRRSKSSCEGVRKLHSAIINLSEYDNNKIDKHITSKAELQSVISQVIANTEKLNKMFHERNEQEETASGRIILEEQRKGPIESGSLKLRVPAGAHTVQLRVTLHSDSAPRPVLRVRGSHSDHEIKRNALFANADKADSWLKKLKNIKKNLSDCGKDSTPTNNPSSQGGACLSQNVSLKDNQTTPKKDNQTAPKQDNQHPKAGQNFDKSGCKPKQTLESYCERKKTTPNSSCDTKHKPIACPGDLKPTPKPPRCSSGKELLPNTMALA
ncbi:unnamed protein product [Parnassius apollo]|uniref:(apollo) hypothetical protein n=1 Tax=Parnassius apollo TaxID=110799 RepID=A0A8S3XUG0_PARAO|nr:unnamed protein product [Parnassius apollo]